jgi:hypothetical protein
MLKDVKNIVQIIFGVWCFVYKRRSKEFKAWREKKWHRIKTCKCCAKKTKVALWRDKTQDLMMRKMTHGMKDTFSEDTSGMAITGANKFVNITHQAMHQNFQKKFPSPDHSVKASIGSPDSKQDSVMDQSEYKGLMKKNDLSPENLTKIITKYVMQISRPGNITTNDLNVSQTDVENIQSEDIDPAVYKNLGYSNFADYKDDLLGYFTPEREQ